MEARPRALQRLQRQRTGEVGDAREPTRADEQERSHRGHELRPVDQRQAFLGGQPDRLEPGSARAHLRPDCSVSSNHACPSPTSGSARWASGARSPLAPTEPRAGTRGSTPRLRHSIRSSTVSISRARVALRQRVRAQQHRGAHDLVRVRLADPARVATQEAQLQLFDLVLRNRLGDEAAEAGVDPVRVLRGLLDERARRGHLGARLVGEPDRNAVHRDLPDVLEPEVVPRQGRTRNHGSESSGGLLMHGRWRGRGVQQALHLAHAVDLAASARPARRSGPATAPRRAAAQRPLAR